MSATVHGFRYDALDAAGVTSRGEVQAETLADARAQLGRRGLLPLAVAPTRSFAARRRRIPVDDVASGFRILADLIDSGFTVGRALAAFDGLAPAGWRPAIPAMREAIREGAALSDALSRAQVVLPSLLIGMVRAGEAGDGLGAALRRAAAHGERTAETLAALRSALAYPAIVAVAGVASISLMLTVVLPRFALLLADLGQALPPSTRRLLAIADLARSALPVAVLAVVVIVAALAWSGRVERAARLRSRGLLALPILGGLWRSILDARVTTALGALLGSGVPVRHAMRFAADAAGDAEIRARILGGAESVTRGEALSAALQGSDSVGLLSIRMIRAGEQSGRVAEMCDHAARLERGRSERIVRAGVRLLEPTLILLFATMVGFVAIALLQAVYAVRPQ